MTQSPNISSEVTKTKEMNSYVLDPQSQLPSCESFLLFLPMVNGEGTQMYSYFNYFWFYNFYLCFHNYITEVDSPHSLIQSILSPLRKFEGGKVSLSLTTRNLYHLWVGFKFWIFLVTWRSTMTSKHTCRRHNCRVHGVQAQGLSISDSLQFVQKDSKYYFIYLMHW